MSFASNVLFFGSGLIGGIVIEKKSMSQKSQDVYESIMSKIKPIFNSIINTIKDILENTFDSIDFESFWINVKTFFLTFKTKVETFNSLSTLNDKFEYLKNEILFFLNSIQKTFKNYKENLITKESSAEEILID